MEKLERLQTAIAYLKGKQVIRTQKDIAAAMQFNESSVSQATNGNMRYLTDSLLKKFCLSFKDINHDWLLHGKGDMININAGNGQQVVLGNGNNNGNITLSQCQQEVETLQARLRDKDEIIALLREKLKQKSKKK
ncbi:MAG: hypothetical protein LBG31_06365 [Prevotellaceae bacterium]|jgi:hypothetical protein|nr:hypothetical protein [Prevotellaceae bacterium]